MCVHVRTSTLLLAAGFPLVAEPVAQARQPVDLPFPEAIAARELDGTIGFSFIGEAESEAGEVVSSVGDINGDGIDDLAIGAFSVDFGGTPRVSAIYVVFGSADPEAFTPGVSFADLDGERGFRFGSSSDEEAIATALAPAGDVNGDGIDDLFVGDSGYGSGGRVYLLFGRSGASAFPASFTTADLGPTDVIRINGDAPHARAGAVVASAGDVNGDGFGDVLIGAPYAMVGGSRSAGSTYVVFGPDPALPIPPVIELAGLDGTNGFRIDGTISYSNSGRVISSAGDLNGDGVDDVIIGVDEARPDGREGAGSAYVVYGRSDGSAFPAVMSLEDVDGTNGFRLDGVLAFDGAGSAVAPAGDVNADGLDDVIVGASLADVGGRTRCGASYVVFGRHESESFPPVLPLARLNGRTGFRIEGVTSRDYAGTSVAGAGDLNGDGIDDVVIGAIGGDAGGRPSSGETYVVFGRREGEFSFRVLLADLDGSDGFRLDGARQNELSGTSVSTAGDVNADGVGDVMVSAPFTRPSGGVIVGEVYIVYGRSAPCLPDLDGDGELTLFDFLEFQNLFDAGDDRADFDEDGRLTLFDFLAFQNAFDAGCG